jgi:allophanate hydrolase subunit 1
MNNAKLKEQELNKLKEHLKNIDELKIQYANYQLQKHQIDEQMKKVYEKIIHISNDYKEYIDYLNKIYGDVKVNYNTGEIIQDNYEKSE